MAYDVQVFFVHPAIVYDVIAATLTWFDRRDVGVGSAPVGASPEEVQSLLLDATASGGLTAFSYR